MIAYLSILLCVGFLNGEENFADELKELSQKLLRIESDNIALRNEVKSMTSRIEELEQRPCINQTNEISESNHRSRRGPNALVAFFAKLSTDLQGIHDHQTIIFDTVHINHGNAYSVHDGEFICHIGGTYFMSWTVSVPEYHATTTKLVVNGVVIAHMMSDSGNHDDFETNTGNVIVDLNPFDRAWVRLSSPAFQRTVSGAGWGFTSFSGFLLG